MSWQHVHADGRLTVHPDSAECEDPGPPTRPGVASNCPHPEGVELSDPDALDHFVKCLDPGPRYRHWSTMRRQAERGRQIQQTWDQLRRLMDGGL